MTVTQVLYHRYKRYRTLQTDHISVLPVVILMPHSACNCRCVMCDIWKDNKNLKQLTENDIRSLLDSLLKLETRKVVMSGGEALLNPHFFRFCEILNHHKIKVSLLSTGLAIRRNAERLLEHVEDIIVSLDGTEEVHDRIRNIHGAFASLREGVEYIKNRNHEFRISSRTVIQRMNYHCWTGIIDAAKDMGIDQVSFLPADVSSHAFNREVLWSDQRKHDILPAEEELPLLKKSLDQVLEYYAAEMDSGFIAESQSKLGKIYEYYAAFYGLNSFPFKKCNAPWVSAVVESDGNVRPCFFHEALGNIREQSLKSILNNPKAIAFRKNLDMSTNPVCVKCVCYLNLSPGAKMN